MVKLLRLRYCCCCCYYYYDYYCYYCFYDPLLRAAEEGARARQEGGHSGTLAHSGTRR